jgi:hypothetical protein
MNKQHKHAELIKAWANGAEIECYCRFTSRWFYKPNPNWSESLEYRIKPKPKWEKRQEVPLFYERYDCYIPQKVHDFDTIQQFVEEFETDFDDQNFMIVKEDEEVYDYVLNRYESLGTIEMSKECAEKLCKMLNNREIFDIAETKVN